MKLLPRGSFFSGNTNAPWLAGSIPIGLRRQAGFQPTMRIGHVPPAAESAAYAYVEHVSGDNSKWPRPVMNRVEFDRQVFPEMRNSCPLNLSVTRMVSPARVTLLYVGSLTATTRPLESRSARRPKRGALRPQDEILSKGKPDGAHRGPRAGEIRSDIGCIRQQDRPKQHPAQTEL